MGEHKIKRRRTHEPRKERRADSNAGQKSSNAFSLTDHIFRKGWLSILYLLIFELWLAITLPATINLHDSPLLNYYVKAIQHIAPVIGKIPQTQAAHPDVVQLYLALTLLLLIPKVKAIHYWMNKKRGSDYGQLVVSPLTTTHAGGVGDYVTEPIRKGRQKQQKERSWFSRIFWSIMIFAFTAAMMWVDLVSGSPNSKAWMISKDFVELGAGGLRMWSRWSLKDMTFLAFLLSISITVGQDYFSFFRNKFGNDTQGEKR